MSDDNYCLCNRKGDEEMVKKVGLIILATLFVASNITYIETSEKRCMMPINVEDEWSALIRALIQVESGGKSDAVGSCDDVGVLQITPIYLEDVNRIAKANYTPEHRYDSILSVEMFNIYQRHYNPEKNVEKAIKLHNPGAGEWYKNRVLEEMNKSRQSF